MVVCGITKQTHNVGDIFCIWDGPVESINEFLEFLNSFYTSIDFTVDIGGFKLNFLDLTLTLLSNQFNFEIYRKETTTDILIHAWFVFLSFSS